MESASSEAALIPAFYTTTTLRSQPNGTHVENTSWEAALRPALYVITSVNHYSNIYNLSRGIGLPRIRALVQSLPGNRSSAQPRTTKVSPGEQVFRASAQPCFPHRASRDSLPRLRKTPYATYSLPCSKFGRLLINYPERAGIPKYFGRS